MTTRESSFMGFVLGLAMIVAAVLGACTAAPPPRFPHGKHLTQATCGREGEPECLRCNGCHTPSSNDRRHRLPEAAVCDRCHREDRSRVHAVLAQVPERQAGDIHFDHAGHLSLPNVGGQCVPCHAGVVKGGSGMPPMSECFECHEHRKQWEEGQCAPCHERKALAMSLPRTFLRHEGNFARRHGNEAVRNERLCRSCHEQSDCDDCHDVSQGVSVERRHPERVDRSFVHRGDFLSLHAMEARSQPSRCARWDRKSVV